MNLALTFAAPTSNGMINSRVKLSTNLVVISYLSVCQFVWALPRSAQCHETSAHDPVQRWIDKPQPYSLPMIVVIYPQSLDFPPAVELPFKCRNSEDCTKVQGL